MKGKPAPNKTIKYKEAQYFSQEEHRDKKQRDLSRAVSQKKPLPKKKKQRRTFP